MTESKLSPEKELELINLHTTVPLTKDQVFCFTVTLCDNEVDRDFERFTNESLEKLGELFIGKTGISDHSMRSKDQRARIFHTCTVSDPLKKNAVGEAYTALKARAYMLRTEETKGLISEIEGGIKKEVSISCSMNNSTCSICGGNMKSHSCKHIKGKTYSGKQCHAVLSEPTDAYEWSFVAVPAQRNAGVTKSFIKKENKILSEPMDIIKSMNSGTQFSDDEIQSIKNYVSDLQQLADEALCYKEHLTEEIKRLALITMPKVNFEKFILGCKNMKANELRDLKDGLEAQAREKLPCAPQIKTANQTKIHNHNQFKI